jgi:hypothetical protein
MEKAKKRRDTIRIGRDRRRLSLKTERERKR